jgi:hypothetical protein
MVGSPSVMPGSGTGRSAGILPAGPPASSRQLDRAGWKPARVKTITQADVMAAGKAAGLVDVKVVKFSDTHTAEKFVIRVADRPARPAPLVGQA